MPMAFGLMVSKPVVVALGMVITAAGYKQFGEAYWNMWDFYSSVLDRYWGPGARTLVFLAAGIQVCDDHFTTIDISLKVGQLADSFAGIRDLRYESNE